MCFDRPYLIRGTIKFTAGVAILVLFLFTTPGVSHAETENEDTSKPAEMSLAVDTPASPEVAGFWDKTWDYLVNGASITVGTGLRQAEMTVTRKSDKASGKIAQRNDQAYFLSYSTRPSFIGKSNFGYTFMLNYSHFNMDKQEVAKDVYQDIGTRVRGNFAYVVPTLYYQWGEHRYKGKFVRLGVGLGLGVTTYSGNIMLSDSSIVEVSNKAYALTVAESLFLEARYRHWGIIISLAGPSVQNDTYKIQVSDVSVNLGYSFYF
jgi:hypothetical protein